MVSHRSKELFSGFSLRKQSDVFISLSDSRRTDRHIYQLLRPLQSEHLLDPSL